VFARGDQTGSKRQDSRKTLTTIIPLKSTVIPLSATGPNGKPSALDIGGLVLSSKICTVPRKGRVLRTVRLCKGSAEDVKRDLEQHNARVTIVNDPDHPEMNSVSVKKLAELGIKTDRPKQGRRREGDSVQIGLVEGADDALEEDMRSHCLSRM
jgi:hypothetical protein